MKSRSALTFVLNTIVASKCQWHGQVRSTTFRDGHTTIETGEFVYDSNSGRFSHAGRSLVRDPLTELDFAELDGPVKVYNSPTHTVRYTMGQNGVPLTWDVIDRITLDDGKLVVVEVRNEVLESQLGIPEDKLLSTPVSTLRSTDGIPWMCDCETYSDYCGSATPELIQACTQMVRIAEEFGFSATAPIGAKGSMLANHPILSHLIANYCNFMPGVGCGSLRLDWNGHGLAGHIPEEFNNLTAYRTVLLRGNALKSPIPELSLPNLSDFDLSGNAFTGSFPTMHTPDLWRLNLARNQFSGTLPSGLASMMPKLRRFWANDNQFTGLIPNDIPFFDNANEPTATIFCDLTNNTWSCPIPAGALSDTYSCGNPTCVASFVQV